MAIKRRLNPRKPLPLHKAGGSVLDPPLYFPVRSHFYDHNPHLDMWPNGARVTSPFGKREILVGHVIHTKQGWRGWIATKQIEVVHLKTGWGTTSAFFYPIVRKKPYGREQAFADFNVHRDIKHAGVFPTRESAETSMIELYEETHDTVLNEW